MCELKLKDCMQKCRSLSPRGPCSCSFLFCLTQEILMFIKTPLDTCRWWQRFFSGGGVWPADKGSSGRTLFSTDSLPSPCPRPLSTLCVHEFSFHWYIAHQKTLSLHSRSLMRFVILVTNILYHHLSSQKCLLKYQCFSHSQSGDVTYNNFFST